MSNKNERTAVLVHAGARLRILVKFSLAMLITIVVMGKMIYKKKSRLVYIKNDDIEWLMRTNTRTKNCAWLILRLR